MSFISFGSLPRKIKVIGLGRAVSFIGDEVALLALAFRVKGQLGHWGVAAVMIAGALPLIVAAPAAGLLVDRVRTRPLLVVTTMFQVLVCLGLATAQGWWTVPLVALLACGTAIVMPAWQALVPQLVSDEQLPQALGFLQSLASIAMVVGPFVGGVMVSAQGTSWPLVVDAGSFVVLAIVAMVVARGRVPAGAGGANNWSEAFSGISLIAKVPVLRAVVVLALAVVLTIGVVNVVEIFFVVDVLHQSAWAYGLLGVCFGVGSAVASVAAGSVTARVGHPERFVLGACVALVGILVLFGLSTMLSEVAIIAFAIGVANAFLNVNATTLFVRESPIEIRGRVFAAIQAVISAGSVCSIAIGGLLLAWFSPRAIIIAGALVGLVALALTVSPVLGAGTSSSTGDHNVPSPESVGGDPATPAPLGGS